MTPGLLVVVLAGGEGRRMGGGKPLRLFRGRTLLAHALERAFSWSSRVAVSVRSPDQVGPVAPPLVLDTPGVQGPLAGLSAALSFAREQGVGRLLTLPCDIPGLPDDLAGRLEQAVVPGAGVAIAMCAGRLHPVCAVRDVEVQASLSTYLAGGRSSVRGFAEAIGMKAVVWDNANATAFENINTQSELSRADVGVRNRRTALAVAAPRTTCGPTLRREHRVVKPAKAETGRTRFRR